MGGNAPTPFTVAQALERIGELSTVLAIMVVRDGKYWRVINRRLRRDDDSEVEVDRYCRMHIAHQLPAAPPQINDEIPY